MDNKQNSNKLIVNGVFWKFSERLVAQGVSFVVSLVLARLLMPEDYGAVAVVTIFIEIANVLLTSGLNTALIQKKEITQEETSTIFYCSLILSAVLYVVMFFAAPTIANAYRLPILIPVTRVFALRLPIAAFQSVQSAMISRNMDFKKSFFSTIGGTITSAVVGIVMAMKGYGVWALIAQYLTSTVADTLILSLVVRWVPTRQFSLKKTMPMISYGWKVMVTDLIGTVFNQLSSMIIGVRYTSTDLAYYTKGKQLPQLLRNNIYTTLISVLFPAMAKVGDDMEAIKKVARKSVRLMSYVIFPMMVGLIVTSDALVKVLYTEKWIQMVPFVCVVCLECMISIVPTVTLQTLKAAGYSDIMLKMEFIKKPILLVSILVAMKFGVMAIALTLPLNTLIDMLLNAYFCDRKIGYSLWESIADIFPALALSGVMGIVVWAVRLLNLATIAELVVQILVGVAVYLLLSAMFKVESFSDVVRTLRERLLKK